MKLKQEIKKLEAKSAEIRFPAPDADSQFEYWQTDLREVIGDNCGYDIAKTLEYDPYEQRFIVQVSARGRLSDNMFGTGLAADNMTMELQKIVSIYPHEPLGPQIEEISSEQIYVQKRFTLLQLLLKEHVTKQKKEGGSK